jgi:proton glutamate symport protein
MWRVWRWKVHSRIGLALIVGFLLGVALHGLDPAAEVGVRLGPGNVVVAVDDAARASGLEIGDRVLSVRGRVLTDPGAETNFDASGLDAGDRVELRVSRGAQELDIRLRARMSKNSTRAAAIAPLDFIAELFRRLLQMLIAPLVFTSLVSGVASLGDLRALGRIGLRTITYYVTTSLAAILLGLVLVNAIAPGRGADLDMSGQVVAADLGEGGSLIGIFLRMVPTNIFGALADNGEILQVIFFGLILGAAITRVGGEPGTRLRETFDAAFSAMTRVAEWVLILIPIGVIVLIARVVGASGFSQFRPLLLFMGTVVLGLVIHGTVVLPLLLWVAGRVHPGRWARAVLPALLTAFSTSSSSITLPVTLRSVQERGRVSNRTASFVLPLGATINMDGTALYECVAVIFLAQHYASVGGFELTAGVQVITVVTALLASIGAAGIPSAGLVMMTSILSVLGLPLEGVMLLLAIDRPLDMLRTTVNVWSDAVCTAVVARKEGEDGIEGALGSR